MENKELQSLINDLKAKLGDNAIDVQLIEDLDESIVSAEPQSKPGPALPNELVAMIARAAEAAAKDFFGDNVVTQMTQLSPVDGSPESAEAMRSMLKGMTPRQRGCYHYILDKQGNPVHCDDREEVRRFQDRNGHILAEDHFAYRDLRMKITTGFIVHNPWDGGEPPVPRWVTQLVREDDGEIGAQELSRSADEAMLHHRAACDAMRRQLAEKQSQRRPSPLSCLAASLDAWLGKRGQQ